MEKFAQSTGSQTSPVEAHAFNTVTCPGCGLLCDDVQIARDAESKLKVVDKGCAKSIVFFERPQETTSPRIAGQPADLQSAIKKAAEILRNANQPLIAGLGTEVQGMRAIMGVADRAGATLDHMNSNGNIRNTLVMQNSGWQVCTLTEVRNRVDLLLIVGTDVVSLFPRFFERNVWNAESMFGQETASREVVYLGGRNIDTAPGISPKGIQPTVLPCDSEHLPEVTAALRALVGGKKLLAQEVAGIAVSDLEKLAERLHAAKYSVVAWSAAALNFPHAELTVQNITELVVKLNNTTRSSGLPLGGSEGDISANQVSTWISGYPVRNSFMRTYPEYDPHHFSATQQIASGEADALIWVSTFNPEHLPPSIKAPTVIIGHANMKPAVEPDVFIPVGTPGIDHKGTMFRSDNVVSLPLSKLRESTLHSLAEVFTAIQAAL
jgi:formylmethanofuran dehydrogenase subunit B